ncbi:MAG: hypothetical protein JWQ79_3838 [Mucilaginibacter sp.]|nr:hypothetical protein [Mucilaginibacter sp.]
MVSICGTDAIKDNWENIIVGKVMERSSNDLPVGPADRATGL